MQPPYRAPGQCFLNSTGEACVSQLTSLPASLARLLQPAPPAACPCFNTSQPDDLPAHPLPIFHQEDFGSPQTWVQSWLFDLARRCTRILPRTILQQDKGCGSHYPLAKGIFRSVLENSGFSRGSDGKESACNAGRSGLIPGLGRPPGEGNGNPLKYSCSSRNVGLK